MMFEHHVSPTLLPPALNQSICWTDNSSKIVWTVPGVGEIIRAIIILFLSLGILFLNILVICVINSQRYSKYIHAQVNK